MYLYEEPSVVLQSHKLELRRSHKPIIKIEWMYLLFYLSLDRSGVPLASLLLHYTNGMLHCQSYFICTISEGCQHFPPYFGVAFCSVWSYHFCLVTWVSYDKMHFSLRTVTGHFSVSSLICYCYVWQFLLIYTIKSHPTHPRLPLHVVWLSGKSERLYVICKCWLLVG